MPSGYGCGYEAVRVGDGLKDFKLGGKPIVGFCHSPSQLDYLVYSICSELQYGSCRHLLNGLASEVTFLGETFEKYGGGFRFCCR